MVELEVGPLHMPLVPVRRNGARGRLPKDEGVTAVLGLRVTAAAILLVHDDRLRLIMNAEDAREGFGGGHDPACLRKPHEQV